MIQWNRPKIKKIQMIHFFKKKFHNYLQPCFYHLVQPNMFQKHIWRDLGPFLHAESFKILRIFRFALMDCPLQFRPEFKSGDWDDHCKTLILFWSVFGGHCLVGRSIYGWVLDSWQRQPDFWLKCPGTWWNSLILTRDPGPLAAPKHQWSTIFECHHAFWKV